MASNKSAAFSSPKFMAGDGCGTNYVDKVVLGAAPAVNDTLEFAIPAGAQVVSIEIESDDLDSNATPLLTFKAGYKSTAAEPQLATNDSYFGTGLTIGRAAGRTILSFKPITFDEPVALVLTVTAAAATFAAGSVTAIAGANCVGIR